MYAYFFGTLGLGIVTSLIMFLRRDLIKVMAYSGFIYLTYGFVMFLAISILSSDPSKAINPGYWNPPSLFNLNQSSGGYGIEDTIFSFFAGAIAAGLYELIFSLKVSKQSNKHLHKGHALLFAILVGSIFFAALPLNAIYFFIILQLSGAAAIVWQRKDLISHAVIGGLFFMILYGLLFLIFNLLFPSFISDYYHLERTSHFMLLGIPLEEFLYALSLGTMFAPIYEYEHKIKDQKRN